MKDSPGTETVPSEIWEDKKGIETILTPKIN
jgi:hypothetical protein